MDKLVSRLTEGDQHIVRTNHVTWLFAQIIRIELVMNALNTDARNVVVTIKFIASFTVIIYLNVVYSLSNAFTLASFILGEILLALICSKYIGSCLGLWFGHNISHNLRVNLSHSILGVAILLAGRDNPKGFIISQGRSKL